MIVLIPDHCLSIYFSFSYMHLSTLKSQAAIVFENKTFSTFPFLTKGLAIKCDLVIQ